MLDADRSSNMDNNNLNGSIPATIGALQALGYLYAGLAAVVGETSHKLPWLRLVQEARIQPADWHDSSIAR